MNARHTSYEAFRDGMLRALMSPTVAIAGERDASNPLAHMDDANSAGPLQALITAWSMVGDVLTFYQERIAEERALSTAREEFSAYAITRMFGYNPRPVVSARAWLCFAANGTAANQGVLVPAGTPVANVPDEGALPAVFESESDLLAYPSWNAVAIPTEAAPAPVRLAPNATRLVLQGTEPIVPGSVLAMHVRATAGVELVGVVVADMLVDRTRDVTLVRWQPLAPGAIAGGEVVIDASLLTLRVRPFGASAPPYALASPQDRRAYALGGVAMRRDAAWSSLSNGLDESPSALAFAGSTLFGIAGTRFFRRAPDEPWSASAAFAGYPAQSIATTPSGVIAVGTTNGNVLISIDGGFTWSAIGDPTTGRIKLARWQSTRLPSVPVRGVAIDESGEIATVYAATDRGVASIPLNGRVWTWNNAGFPGTDAKTGVAALAATSIVLADAAGTLLVTTTYGVFRSVRGHVWTRMQGLGSVASVASLDGDALIAIGPGGVFRSNDTGETWEKALTVDGTPHALAARSATVAVALGKDVYTSDDAGQTWTRVPAPIATPAHAIAVGRDGTVAVAAPFVDDPSPDWPGLVLGGDIVRLDREVPVVPGDVIAVSQEYDGAIFCEAYSVRSSTTAMLAAYGISGMSTRLVLDRPLSPKLNDARRAIVHLSARARAVEPVRRETLPPPTLVLDVPRGLARLPAGRMLAIEGQRARVLLGALAGGALRIEGARMSDSLGEMCMLRSDTDVSPVLDVDSVTSWGDRGVIVSRFDGIWRCTDVTAAPWQRLAAAPARVTSLAAFDGALYATCAGETGTAGVYALGSDAWQLVLAGPMRRVIAAGDTLWACSQNGLYQLRDGAWSVADRRFEGCAVNDIAGDPETVLAGTDDGAYVRDARGWRRVDGLNNVKVNAVALSRDAWYAGTNGAGTWQSTGGAPWTPLDGRRTAQVTSLFVDGERVFAAERGIGVTDRGAPLDITLATNVVGFVTLNAGGAREIVAFRGTPLLPPERSGDAYVPMRRWVGCVPNDGAEVQTLDAGMLSPALRTQLEGVLNVKLATVQLVVEESGRAWRLQADDPLPVFLIRREPESFAVFSVARVELAAPPDPPPPGSVSCRWTLCGDWNTLPSILARDDELWYTGALPGSPLQAETAVLAAQSDAQIVLRRSLANAYDAQTVNICANVVEATHGATIPRDDAVASGDASVPAQSATLASTPLTNLLEDAQLVPALDVWVRADVSDDPVAATAALSNRLHDDEMIRWDRVVDFAGSGPDSPHYMLRQDASGLATLTFGDGENGRRLPTGRDNVIARYRVGGGASGNVAARRLALFQRPHAGLGGVSNPLPSTGGVDAERVQDVRVNAPRGMVALGRVVSERDLADYVAAWPGVEKVDVARVLRRSRSVSRSRLLITLASRTAVDVDALGHALRHDGAAAFDIQFATYRERRFSVAATLFADRRYDFSDVLRAACDALVQRYAFEQRALREDVLESSIVALLQRTEGVSAVTPDSLVESTGIPASDGRLTGDDGASGEAASLLLIDPAAITIRVLQA